MVKIKVSSVKKSDIHGIQEVFYKTWLATYPNKKFGIKADDIKDRFKNSFSKQTFEKIWERIKNSIDEETLIAKDKNKVIGVCRIVINKERNQLQAIYILPEYQGIGIGKLLWKETNKLFNLNKDIFVEVASYNKRAISFYKKLGFVSTGRKWLNEKYKMKSGAVIPEIEMVLKTNNINYKNIIKNTKKSLIFYLTLVKVIPEKNIIKDKKIINQYIKLVFNLLLIDDTASTKSKILEIIENRDTINKKIIIHILEEIDLVKKGVLNPLIIHKEYYIEHLIIKLITHIISFYSDEEYHFEKDTHTKIAGEFSIVLSKIHPRISVISVGSVFKDENSMWHPFYSDIDIVPLQHEKKVSAAKIRKAFKAFATPVWLRINYGGQKGIGKLRKDPLDEMYVTEKLYKLNNIEIKYLKGLFSNNPILLSGNKKTKKDYFKKLNNIYYRQG